MKQALCYQTVCCPTKNSLNY